MPFQWSNQFWQSLAEGAGKRVSECSNASGVALLPVVLVAEAASQSVTESLKVAAECCIRRDLIVL